MANLPESPFWTQGIYQIDIDDDVQGGPLPDGISNRQGKELADRTAFLKNKADNLIAGFSYVSAQPKAASTGNINVQTGGLLELDGVALSEGDTVLLKDQTDKRENGLYVAASGAWARHPSFADGSENVFDNQMLDVRYGAVNVGRIYMIDMPGNYTVGVDNLVIRETVFSYASLPAKMLVRDRNGEFTGGSKLGGYIDAHDFGSATPTQQDLTDYACENIGIPPEDSNQILNGTRVKNLFDNHVWILANTPDTEPPVFWWSNDGQDSVAIATEEMAGIVKASEDVEVDPETGAASVSFIALSRAGEGGVNALVDESKARNLLDVLGIRSQHSDDPATPAEILAAMAAISERCNGTGAPDWSGLSVGDYLDGIDLSGITAGMSANAANTAGQAWSDEYKNNRIVLAGFNPYKGAGDTETTENHLLFVFRNIPLKARMNTSDTCIGGYSASAMRAFLEGSNGTTLTGTFLGALKQQLYGDGDSKILPVRRLLSTRPSSSDSWAWLTCSLFLPSEHEVFGESAWGDAGRDDGTKVRFPLYAKSALYRVKRYNGSRDWHWECSPHAASAANFANVNGYGGAGHSVASAVGGCAPAFCAA